MKQFTRPKAVTHPSTNRARCRATALIETNALPLHQTANLCPPFESNKAIIVCQNRAAFEFFFFFLLVYLSFRLPIIPRKTPSCLKTWPIHHRPKIRIFVLHGRLVAPIQVKFSVAKGTMGLLGRTDFCASRCTGVGMRLPKRENFHIPVKSRSRGANCF